MVTDMVGRNVTLSKQNQNHPEYIEIRPPKKQIQILLFVAVFLSSSVLWQYIDVLLILLLLFQMTYLPSLSIQSGFIQ